MFGLRGSAERVLRIENPSGNPHLRGMAFDFYYSGRWGPSFNDRPYRSALQGLAPEGADRILGAETVTITRLVGRNSLLYAPLETAAIDRGDAEDVEWSPDFGGPIRTRFRPPYEYILTIPPQENYQGLLATRLNPEQRKRALQIPERLDPRIAQLAQQITAQAKTPQAKIEAVISYLLANHRYSLYFRRSGGDPLEDFLLTEPKKDAHCEYFASAATILLRCVGVPSRYITGYYAHESAGENQVVVRQRDAHAWSEAWVEGVGWVTVEATPGDGRPDAQDQEIEWWRNLIEKIQDAWKAFTDWLGERTQEQINVTVSVFLLGGVLYGAFIYARKRRAISTIPGFAYSSASAHLAALVARFEAAFTKKGVPFPAHLTYSEHLDNLAKNTPEALQTGNWIDAGRRFIRYYDAARFGGQWDDATRNALETIVQELEQAEKSKPETQAS
jgi:transglutaminase-like putative cysteine protease